MLASKIRGLLGRLPRRRPLCARVATGEMIDELMRRHVLAPSEAHALKAGDKLADLYEETADARAEVSSGDLELIREHLSVGELEEAIIQLGRAHPHLAGLPHLFERMR